MKRLLLSLVLALLSVALLPARSVHALDPYALYHQAAADMDAASTFVERSVVSEQTSRVVIDRTVIAEYDQQHGRTRIHAYETRRTRDARGAWRTQTRYLDLVFLGSRTYVRISPDLRWRSRAASHFTDASWRDAFTGAPPALGDLPSGSLRLVSSTDTQAHLRVRTSELSGDLWIDEGSTPYLVRFQAAYDREVGGQRGRVQEDSRLYSFNRPLKITAPHQ